jgi:hypothetical protein
LANIQLPGLPTAAAGDDTDLYHVRQGATDKTLTGLKLKTFVTQSDAEIKTAYEANANTNEFSDTEQTKLAGIETSATADQTNAEIKTAYEANANTNEFSDTEQTKLSGIETGATQTTNANWSGTDLAIVNGGTGSSTASGAFTNIKQAASETVTGVSELATQAEVDGNTGGDRVVTSDTLNGFSGAAIFTKAFTSSQQTITNAGQLTLAHSLGAIPTLIQFRLKCLTAEAGYSIGDELMVSHHAEEAAGGRGVSTVPDATNIVIRYAAAANVFRAVTKTTGAEINLTHANWRLIVKAWA